MWDGMSRFSPWARTRTLLYALPYAAALSFAHLYFSRDISAKNVDLGRIQMTKEHWINFEIDNPGETKLNIVGVKGICDCAFSTPFPFDVPPGESKKLSFHFTPSVHGKGTLPITFVTDGHAQSESVEYTFMFEAV